jgi:hypothetical protein
MFLVELFWAIAMEFSFFCYFYRAGAGCTKDEKRYQPDIVIFSKIGR